MRWRKADLQKYIQEKEYIDTAIVPLMPFQISDDAEMEKSSFQSELLSIITNEIEKELTGRVLLLPSYNYLKKSDSQLETKRLNTWADDAFKQSFKSIFFITFDAPWKKSEKELNGTLIWLPAIQAGDLHSKEMQPIIQDQVKQMIELIRSYW